MSEKILIDEYGFREYDARWLFPDSINELGIDYEPNFDKGLLWCDVASMLRIQNERMKDSYFPTTREYAQQYGLDLNRLNSIKKKS